jgi:hypothetical protein
MRIVVTGASGNVGTALLRHRYPPRADRGRAQTTEAGVPIARMRPGAIVQRSAASELITAAPSRRHR